MISLITIYIRLHIPVNIIMSDESKDRKSIQERTN